MSEKYGHLEVVDVADGHSHQPRHDSKKKLTIALILMSVLAFGLFVALCAMASKLHSEPSPSSPPSSSNDCDTSQCITLAAETLTAMDTDVKPCDDFYSYACGGWKASHPIPDDKTRYSTFSVLSDRNDLVLRNILAKNYTKPLEKSTTLFYQSCINEEAINERGNKPVVAKLKELEWTVDNQTAWVDSDRKAFSDRIAQLTRIGISSMFSMGVGPDDKDSSQNAFFLSQGGLSLPDRSYYNTTKSDQYVIALTTYLTELFTLANINNAATLASEVVAFETELAKITVPRAELRDPVKTYNPLNLTQLKQSSSFFNWKGVFESVFPDTKITSSFRTIVSTPSFLSNVSDTMNNLKPSTAVAYLQSRVLLHFARHLSSDFLAVRLNYMHVVYGTKKEAPRWKTCLQRVNSGMGFVLGRSFVDETFNGQSLKIANKMIQRIIDDFIANFPRLEWMDKESRVAAEEKARAISVKVGYPEWLYNDTRLHEEYDGLSFESDYFENVARVDEFQETKSFRDLGKPVDKSKWYMTPSTVNAYYDPSSNEIVFPAGIMQPPFFNAAWPLAANFGGIGAVIGHEISHGFDDQGRQFDGSGNQRDWWTETVVSNFKERADCLMNQYSRFPMSLGAINGALTLGENIADNGGVQASFRALFKESSNTKSLPGVHFTKDQLYFLRYAQVWCRNTRPQETLRLLTTDPHSPSEARVNLPLSNSPTFHSAFSCPKGSPMNPTDTCKLW